MKDALLILSDASGELSQTPVILSGSLDKLTIDLQDACYQLHDYDADNGTSLADSLSFRLSEGDTSGSIVDNTCNKQFFFSIQL